MNITNTFAVVVSIIAITVGVGIGVGWSDDLSDFGGPGESCYPGDTCEKNLTCFRFRDEKRCEKKVEVVWAADMPACYEVAGKQACFPTLTECQVHFARHVGGTAGEVIGCGP